MNPSIELDAELSQALEMARDLDEQSCSSLGANPAEVQVSASDAFWNGGGAQMAEIIEFTIPGPFRPVPAVLRRPSNTLVPSPALVYFHGGGFSSGSHRSNDRQMRDIAAAWGGVVISADYVHVPKHAFPDAIVEASSVLLWLHQHGAKLGVDGEHLTCGGYSAGASIGFATALQLSWPSWLVGMVSIAAAINSDTSTDSMRRYGDGDLYPSRRDVEMMFERYATSVEQHDPRCNILLAEVTQMPSTFIAAAEYDVFLDASIELSRRLEVARRPHQLTIYRGMSHMFFGYSRSVAQAQRCVLDIADYLQRTNPATPEAIVRA